MGTKTAVETTVVEKLSEALRGLHSALVVHGKLDYEREREVVAGPGQLLHLLANDPFFAWLRPLSELMADIDLLTSKPEDDASAEILAAIRLEVSTLFDPRATTAFATRCLELLQDPNIALAHSAVKRALAELPSLDPAEALHATHRWNEIRRHRRAPIHR